MVCVQGLIAMSRYVRDLVTAENFAHFNDISHRFAEAFWPGPLTLVLPAKVSAISPAVTAGLPTIALRVPSDPTFRAVLSACSFPLAAPSANQSGRVSPSKAEHVLSDLGNSIDMIIDGGDTALGLESTIVAVRNDRWELLRHGPVTVNALEDVQFSKMSATSGHVIEAPGQLGRHYYPGKPVRLDANIVSNSEFVIGFHDIEGDINLSRSGDLEEAARRLYICLHAAANSQKTGIAVAPIPSFSIGQAINERLIRASTAI